MKSVGNFHVLATAVCGAPWIFAVGRLDVVLCNNLKFVELKFILHLYQIHKSFISSFVNTCVPNFVTDSEASLLACSMAFIISFVSKKEKTNELKRSLFDYFQ